MGSPLLNIESMASSENLQIGKRLETVCEDEWTCTLELSLRELFFKDGISLLEIGR